MKDFSIGFSFFVITLLVRKSSMLSYFTFCKIPCGKQHMSFLYKYSQSLNVKA